MGNVVLVVFNLLLLAMLVMAWQLWRQAVPRRAKITQVDASDWPTGPQVSAELPVDTMAVAAVVGSVEQPEMAFAGDINAPSPLVADLDSPAQPPLVSDSLAAPPFDSVAGRITDDDLARLLGNAPAGSVAAPAPPAIPVQAPSPIIVAPPAAADTGDEIASQVSSLLEAPPSTPRVGNSSNGVPDSVGTPPAVVPELRASVDPHATDFLRLDLTGRKLAEVLATVAARFEKMGYRAQLDSAGETSYSRGAHESLRVSIVPSASVAGVKPENPGSAKISVVGGQLQETTEAVLFELLNHGFQLRGAVAGELVLSSEDGALARVNVNPAE